MYRPKSKRVALIALTLTASFLLLLAPGRAADHGDAPFLANDRGADIADTYIFLDPADNTKVIIAGTINGFIVPNEMVNFGVFDENLRYRFEIENTGDPRPDIFIDVTFTPKQTASTQVQTATIAFSTGQTFTAPGTVPTLNPTPPDPVVTTDAATGIKFFAGVADDPFNFDITGFARFTAACLRPCLYDRLHKRGQNKPSTRARQLRGLQHSLNRPERAARADTRTGKHHRSQLSRAATKQSDGCEAQRKFRQPRDGLGALGDGRQDGYSCRQRRAYSF